MGLRGSTLVIKFVFTLFIARFMGFEDLGIYGLITAAIIFIAVFFGMGFTHALTRKVVTQTPEDIVKNFWSHCLFIICVYCLLLCVFSVVGFVINELSLAFLIVFLALLEHINNYTYLLILNRSKFLSGNVLHFIRSGAWMVIFMPLSLFIPSMMSMESILIYWIVGNVVSLLLFLWLTRHWPWLSNRSDTSLFNWSKSEFVNSKIAYTESMVFTSTTYIDRYIVTFFLGLEMTGVYVFFWSIGSALSNLISTGVIQIYRPKMVQAFKDSSTKYAEIFITCLKRTLMVSSVIGVITGIAIYMILPYVNRPLVIEWYPVLWPVILGFVIIMMYQVQNLIFYSQHRDEITLKISIASLIGMIAVNLTLIPIIGIWGAASAYALVALFSVVVQYVYIKKFFSDQGIYP